MSASLRNKQYVFRGAQLTKEQYKEEMSKIHTGSYEVQEKCLLEFKQMIKDSIHRYARIFKSENCNGDYIENSRNVRDSFEVFKAENRTLKEVGEADRKAYKLVINELRTEVASSKERICVLEAVLKKSIEKA